MTFRERRTLAELRFATRVFMARHRVRQWTPPEPPARAAFVPEWVRRGIAKDMTNRSAA